MTKKRGYGVKTRVTDIPEPSEAAERVRMMLGACDTCPLSSLDKPIVTPNVSGVARVHCRAAGVSGGYVDVQKDIKDYKDCDAYYVMK